MSARELSIEPTWFYAARPENPPDIIESADLRIDVRAGEARLRGQELQLSEQEFELLRLLLAHPTKIITPQTRLNMRRGRKPFRQPEVLRILTELRQNLAAAGCSDYIRAEQWVVCRFHPPQRNGIH